MSKKWIGSISLVFLVVSIVFFSYIEEIKTYRYNKENNIITTDEIIYATNQFLKDDIIRIKIKYIKDLKQLQNSSKLESSKLAGSVCTTLMIYMQEGDYGKQEIIHGYKTKLFMTKEFKEKVIKSYMPFNYLYSNSNDLFLKKSNKKIIDIIIYELIQLYYSLYSLKECNFSLRDIIPIVKLYPKESFFSGYKLVSRKDLVTIKRFEKRMKFLKNNFLLTLKKTEFYIELLEQINRNRYLKKPEDNLIWEKYEKLYSKANLMLKKDMKNFENITMFMANELINLVLQMDLFLGIIEYLQKYNNIEVVNIIELKNKIYANKFLKDFYNEAKDRSFGINLISYFDGNFTLTKESVLAYIAPFTNQLSSNESKKIYLLLCDLKKRFLGSLSKKQLKLYKQCDLFQMKRNTLRNAKLQSFPLEVFESNQYKSLLRKVLYDERRIKWYKKEILKNYKRRDSIIDFFIFNSVELYLGVSGLYLLYVLVFLSAGISRISKERRIKKIKEGIREKIQEKKEKEEKEEKEKFLQRVKKILKQAKEKNLNHRILKKYKKENKKIEDMSTEDITKEKITEEEILDLENEVDETQGNKEQKAKDRNKEEGNIKEALELLKEIQDAEILKELTNKLEKIKEELKTTNRPKKLDRKITKLIDDIEKALTK